MYRASIRDATLTKVSYQLIPHFFDVQSRREVHTAHALLPLRLLFLSLDTVCQ